MTHLQRARFRLSNISIEGFKGFTVKQDIPLNGKHIFLFGKNGSGKSSIVEAIRWCLFGLAERPETEVRNAYYAPGECNVELELLAEDGIWHVKRSLRPGAERSRIEILDPAGKEALVSSVFPYLARLGPREGTHVIFAAQQASGRRPQADISDFHKVLYSYLHLEEVPDMLENLDNLLEQQRSVRDELANDIGTIEEEYRTKLSQVGLSLSELLRNPPWTGSKTPTTEETALKITTFASELAKFVEQQEIQASPEELLEKSEEWLVILRETNQDVLKEKHRTLLQSIKTITNALQIGFDAEKRRLESQEKILRLKQDIANICGNMSLEEVADDMNSLREQLTERHEKLSIAIEAEKSCKSDCETECPVCLAKYTEGELAERIKANIEKATPEQAALVASLEKLQGDYAKASLYNQQLGEWTSVLHKAQDEQTLAFSQIRAFLNLTTEEPVTEEDTKARLAETITLANAVETQLRSAESQYDKFAKRIDAFRTELRFHEYRSKQNQLQNLLTFRLKPLQDQLREFVELENTVHDIRKELKQAFDEAIDRAIPHLNDMMTSVYGRLTAQASFEKIVIERGLMDDGNILRFRVGSDEIPGQLYDPQDVLNGQANSALRLVPYFVFSKFQAQALELDLLLIDDPSQSFDTSHVESLLQELANAGSHAQLVIATHEEDRFGPNIGNYFAANDFETAQFADSKFDRQKGPSFVIKQ